MTKRSWLPIALLSCLVLGCAAVGADVIKGSVAYRERMALPPDAVVEVWIIDESPMNLAVPVIAETTVRSAGRQVPIPFELRYDPGRIELGHVYGIRAAIRSGGQILFATSAAHPMITQGNPTQVDLWLERAAAQSASGSGGMLGTAWRLEDLGGAGVLARVEATLAFPEAGKVAGSGSCNRFFGTVEISGERITFCPLGATRMACAEAIGIQEAKYLEALQGAERFERDGTLLLIYSKGIAKPMRFVRKES